MQFFLSGFLLSLSLCLDLGIVNVAIIKAGLEHGFKPSVLIGLGSSIGDLFYACLTMIGISLLLHYVYIQWILWIGGTIALVYLCVRTLKETIRPRFIEFNHDDNPQGATPWVKNLLIGLGLALSSPSSIGWFATVGGSIIASTGQRSMGSSALAKFFLGFFCAGVVWSLIVAFVSGQTRKWMGPNLLRFNSLLSAVLFVYFAVKVFLNGLQHLL